MSAPGHVLSLLLALPVLGAIAIGLIRRENERAIKLLALALTTGIFLLSLLLVRSFRPRRPLSANLIIRPP